VNVYEVVIVILKSFGFKYGTPRANYYFDVSFIVNPARVSKWGLMALVDDEMRQFVLGQDKVSGFIEMVVPLIEFIDTLDGGLVVAFGCNSGRHRSVIVVDEIARLFKERGRPVNVSHTDLG
jgi:UPF0042 nucleotide-binding protein